MGCPCSQQTVQQTPRKLVSPLPDVLMSRLFSHRQQARSSKRRHRRHRDKSHHVPSLLSSSSIETMRNMECCVNHRLPYSPASWATQRPPNRLPKPPERCLKVSRS